MTVGNPGNVIDTLCHVIIGSKRSLRRISFNRVVLREHFLILTNIF